MNGERIVGVDGKSYSPNPKGLECRAALAERLDDLLVSSLDRHCGLRPYLPPESLYRRMTSLPTSTRYGQRRRGYISDMKFRRTIAAACLVVAVLVATAATSQSAHAGTQYLLKPVNNSKVDTELGNYQRPPDEYLSLVANLAAGDPLLHPSDDGPGFGDELGI
jgi:hypothetical protein